MSALSLLPPSCPDDFGFVAAPSSIGAAQRASLGRGLAFVLMLAACSLASIYLPVAYQGPRWVAGTASPPAFGH